MVNKAILIGNVGADPEVRTTQSGKRVANFKIATSSAKDVTEWHSIVAWDKLAELVEKYVKKGGQLYVEGEIRTRSYDASDGTKRYMTEIWVYSIKLLGRKADNSTPTQATNDDIPF